MRPHKAQFSLRKFSAALALLSLFVGLTTPADAGQRSRSVGVSAREALAARALQFEALPLERSRQNHLLVRTRLNGKPALFVVDTGAALTAIAANRVAHFGLTPPPANGELPARLRINGGYGRLVVSREFQLGALNLIEQPMVALDLSGSRQAAEEMNEQAIDGVLGADILFPTAAVLDCRAKMLILKMDENVRGEAPGLDYSGYTRIPMEVTSGYKLYVDGRFNGLPAKLMVDTGAFGTLMHQPFVRQMKIPTRKSGLISAAVNLKQRGVRIATISRFSVGAMNMRKKEVGVINLEGLIVSGALNASPPVAGLLGSEILADYNGIIDFGTRSLYLKD